MKLDGDNCKVFCLILPLHFYLVAKYVSYVGFFGYKLLFATVTEGGRNYSKFPLELKFNMLSSLQTLNIEYDVPYRWQNHQSQRRHSHSDI